MEAGELELRKAFEEVTTGNVKAILDYCQKTREIVREQEQKILKLEEMIRNQNITIDFLRSQLANVQSQVFSGGT